MNPESTYSFTGPWLKAQDHTKSSSAAKALRETLWTENDNDIIRLPMLDERRTQHRHQLIIDKNSQYRLWLFGDFSCILAKQRGLMADAHPMILRLNRTDGTTKLKFRRRHTSNTAQLWFQHPNHMTRSYAMTIGYDSDTPGVQGIQQDATAFLAQHPFESLPEWNGNSLYSWQRPSLSLKQESFLKSHINFAATIMANHLGVTLPDIKITYRQVNNGRPTAFTITPPAVVNPRLLAGLNAFLDNPVLGAPETQVNYYREGKGPKSFYLRPHHHLDLSAHAHMSIAQAALNSLETSDVH